MSSTTDDRGHHELPGPIPSTVSTHLCVDFVNSEFADHRTGAKTFDRLAMLDWRCWFLRRCGLPPASRLDTQTRSEAVELRRMLRDLLTDKHQPNDAQLAVLNHFLCRVVLRRGILRDRGQLLLKPAWQPEGWRAAFAAVVVSYIELTSRRRAGRVRVCANPNCTYLFVDDSRNGRRRWCAPELCGNLMHVRSFRQRSLH